MLAAGGKFLTSRDTSRVPHPLRGRTLTDALRATLERAPNRRNQIPKGSMAPCHAGTSGSEKLSVKLPGPHETPLWSLGHGSFYTHWTSLLRPSNGALLAQSERQGLTRVYNVLCHLVPTVLHKCRSTSQSPNLDSWLPNPAQVCWSPRCHHLRGPPIMLRG